MGVVRERVKAQLGRGVRQAVRLLEAELRAQARHRAGVRSARRLRVAGPIRLNLGCGSQVKAGWVNVDLWAPEADLSLDLREEFPFPDGCAEIVHSEHVFEHLRYPDEAMRFLAESFRVLAPGGRFRVGVPDTEWPLVAYATGDEQYFRLARERWHPAGCTTRMHQINYHFRQGIEHKYAYDAETLVAVVAEAGFTSVARAQFDPALDSEHRRIGTLYVDGWKPR